MLAYTSPERLNTPPSIRQLMKEERTPSLVYLVNHSKTESRDDFVGFSKFYERLGVALTPGYDAHFIPVKDYGYTHPVTGNSTHARVGFQAAPASQATYHELVVHSPHQCIPIAVVYFHPKPPSGVEKIANTDPLIFSPIGQFAEIAGQNPLIMPVVEVPSATKLHSKSPRWMSLAAST